MLVNHTSLQLLEFLQRLDRIEKYLNSSKLKFKNGVLELNVAPFKNADKALPLQSPLSYITLFMRETVWSEEDLASRKIMLQSLRSWVQHEITHPHD
jgi:hypothetical protein